MVFFISPCFLDFSVICFGFLCDFLDFSLSKVIMVVVELESGGRVAFARKQVGISRERQRGREGDGRLIFQ